MLISEVTEREQKGTLFPADHMQTPLNPASLNTASRFNNHFG